jgi:PAS domain S-box-containing protein
MNHDTVREEKFVLREKHYKKLFENIPLPIFLIESCTLRILDINQAAITSYGYSREEFLDMTIKDIVPKEETTPVEDLFAGNWANLFHFGGWKHIKKDETIICTEIFAKNIDFKIKKARLIVVNDITNFYEVDKTLQLNSEIIESSEDAIISKTLDGVITSWNKGAEQMYGYSKLEILNKPISILIPPEKSGEFENIMSKIKNGEPIDHYQTTRLKKDGSRIFVSVSISSIKDKFNKIIGASTIARDITGLKHIDEEREIFIKKEMELKEQTEKIQHRLMFLSEASKIIFSSLDYETIIASIAGISVPFICDWCVVDLINEDKKIKRVAVVHSDADKKKYADQFQQIFKDVPKEATEVYQVMLAGKSKIISVASTGYFQDKKFNNEFISILNALGISSFLVVPLKSRNNVLGAMTLVMKEATRHFDEEDILFVEEIASRAATAIDNVMLYRDLQVINTELEQRVKRRTEQLEAANSELETFSYSVSHDLKAPLRAIEGFSRILLEEHAGDLNEEAKRLFNIVISNTSRMSQLIEDLLEFSKLTRIQMNRVRIDMMKLVKNVFNELKNFENGRNITLTLNNLSTAEVDPAMMRQVWINLIANSIKFTRTRDSAIIQIGTETSNGNNIYYIKDNGVGFDMKYSQNLFGVFQRLHRYKDFEGTGVGLALVERIVKRHGGRIWADAKLNEGASFYFTLEDTEVHNG